MIHEARNELAGSVEMLTQDMEIDAPEETWLWGGVLMKADSNRIVSVHKVGKTTLLVAMIAVWWSGAQGAAMCGHRCPSKQVDGSVRAIAQALPNNCSAVVVRLGSFLWPSWFLWLYVAKGGSETR